MTEKSRNNVEREDESKCRGIQKKLLEKYMAKILFRWNNEKFENEYLKKLERN